MTETEQSYFGNAFAEAVFRRTYSRFRYDLGRRETWEESVQRVTDFLDETAQGMLTREEVNEIHDAILKMEALPSMRSFAMGGEAVKQNAIALYNCFSGMTTFISRSGLRTLSGAAGETVDVLSADGEWRAASVQSFGFQRLQRVVLEHYNGGKHGTYRHYVDVTPDHRWLLSNGSETTALKVGDKLFSPDLSSAVADAPLESVQHGFFYGDGTLNNIKTKPFAQVRLCGAKNKHVDTLFGEFSRSYPPSCHGDAMVYCGTSKIHWKSLPTNTDPQYVYGFIRGLFLADGSTTDGGNLCISTQNADLADWLETFSGLAGYKILSTRQYNADTNYGKRSSTLHMITMGKGDSALLRVIDIQELHSEEEVFCVVEPETHTFTLGNGQVTGNCSYLPVDSLDAFVETLLILMSGTGVGFSIEARYVGMLPVVQTQIGEGPGEVFQVPDTTEGWADALRIGLEHWFFGKDISFDYGLVRPGGTPLRTKGGRASGPAPLKDLLDYMRSMILNAQGRQLTTLECLDAMTRIASIVVVGGVRRSSEISLSDLNDNSIREAKIGEFWTHSPHRALSNNSAVYEVKPSWENFKTEWDSLATSGTGERGIFNRASLEKNKPSRRTSAVWGGNPCFSPGTLIHTRNGHFPIETLVGKKVDIWNGLSWQTVDNFRVTARNQPILKITMQDGTEERVTPYHSMILDDGQRVQAKDLQPGDRLMLSTAPESHGDHVEPGAYLKGFLIGDGTRISPTDAGDYHSALYLYEPKYVCEDRLVAACNEIKPSMTMRSDAITTPAFRDPTPGQKRKVMQGVAARSHDLRDWSDTYKYSLPVNILSWSEQSKAAFIAGVMDADGTALDSVNGYGYQITSIHRQWLSDFQRLLQTMGVNAKISKNRDAGMKDFNDGYGAYPVKAQWRLIIAQSAAIILSRKVTFDRLISFDDRVTAYTLKSRRNKVVSVEPDGIEDEVYCCTVEGSHSIALTSRFQVGQCLEISLRPYSFCNLSEVVARADDTYESLARKVRIATIIGTVQSLVTDFPYLRPVWKTNAEEERLLGVSVTGQVECPAWRDSDENMRALRQVAIDTNLLYAKRFGINQSAAITCTKPSGSASSVVNASAGIHPRYSRWYVRRMRISSSDPLLRVFTHYGVPMQPEVGQDAETANTWVLEFPVASPETSITRRDLTAIEQIKFWLRVKRNWAEHTISCTVYVENGAWEEVGAFVYENFDDITGLSFLPKDDFVYQLAPYEEITEAQYNKLSAEFPKISYGLLRRYEKMGVNEATREYSCVGDKCDIL